MEAAVDALEQYGFGAARIRRSILSLLKVYGHEGWPFFEENGYEVVVDSLLSDQRPRSSKSASIVSATSPSVNSVSMKLFVTAQQNDQQELVTNSLDSPLGCWESNLATNSKGVDTNDIVDADALTPGWWGPAFGTNSNGLDTEAVMDKAQCAGPLPPAQLCSAKHVVTDKEMARNSADLPPGYWGPSSESLRGVALVLNETKTQQSSSTQGSSGSWQVGKQYQRN